LLSTPLFSFVQLFLRRTGRRRHGSCPARLGGRLETRYQQVMDGENGGDAA
jgi:hypothetical protein